MLLSRFLMVVYVVNACFIFLVIRGYGDVAATPTYFFVAFFVVGWITELLFIISAVVKDLQEERGVSPKGSTVKRILKKNWGFLVAVLVKVLLTFSVFSKLRMLERLLGSSS